VAAERSGGRRPERSGAATPPQTGGGTRKPTEGAAKRRRITGKQRREPSGAGQTLEILSPRGFGRFGGGFGTRWTVRLASSEVFLERWSEGLLTNVCMLVTMS